MLFKPLAFVLLLSVSCTSVSGACERDRNVQLQAPLYLNFGDGFFFIHGLTNGESVVMYKHPDDTRIFGQYTFKDERCLYETVYYYVANGKYEFTNPYVTNDANFNITNKINFVRNGAGYEIEYNVSPRGLGIFQNLGQDAEQNIIPTPTIKKTPAPRIREINPKFENLGKQNLKVSFLKNGESYIQFISKRSSFISIEGQYTLRTSDRKYHTITYEIPIEELDYNGLSIREYEMSTEENFFKTGTLRIGANGTEMDVKYFINSRGFHVGDVVRQDAPGAASLRPVVPVPLQGIRQGNSPLNNLIDVLSPANQRVNNRPVRNQRRPVRTSAVRGRATPRFLNPSFSRPDLLTGERSVQPGK